MDNAARDLSDVGNSAAPATHGDYLTRPDLATDLPATKLVRDCETESYDPPPPGPPKVELAEVPDSQQADDSDLRRADDLSAGPATYDRKAAFWAALDSVAVYGPMK